MAEQQALQADATSRRELGEQLTQLAIRDKLAEIQRELAAIGPRFKPLKVARNKEIARLKRELRRLEPYKPAGRAAKAPEALT